MFGLVPKPIWAKLIRPNEQNGIPQNANCMVVELDDGRVGLVDTGCGDPCLFSDKEKKRNGLSTSWPLLDELQRLHIDPADIDFVVLTHLHWDHVGGTHRINNQAKAELTFSNAQHFIHSEEWFDATHHDPLLYKSYPQSSIQPLLDRQNDAVVLVTDVAPDILPGIRMARSGGHTRGHCVVVLQHDDLVLRHPQAEQFSHVNTLACSADLCSTQHHLLLVFQTSFDSFPLQTRQWKQETLPAIADDGILLMFGHDPDCFGALIARDEKTEFCVTQLVNVSE